MMLSQFEIFRPDSPVVHQSELCIFPVSTEQCTLTVHKGHCPSRSSVVPAM